jgi:hypothetical protein
MAKNVCPLQAFFACWTFLERKTQQKKPGNGNESYFGFCY